jgi:uncharacterized membrane protein
VTIDLGLAIASVGVLIYFIHHSAIYLLKVLRYAIAIPVSRDF